LPTLKQNCSGPWDEIGRGACSAAQRGGKPRSPKFPVLDIFLPNLLRKTRPFSFDLHICFAQQRHALLEHLKFEKGIKR